MDAATERRLLGLLGLGLRSRRAVLGVERVREAARRGTLRVAVVAADASANSRQKVDGLLAAIEGLPTATVVVLEAGGYRTLNDIIDLDRDDFLRLPGIAPEEADRIIAILDELTEEGNEAAAPAPATGPESA